MSSRKLSRLALAGASLLAFAASPASATILEYTLTDAQSNQVAFWYMDSNPATWYTPSNPLTPNQEFTGWTGDGFVVTNIQGDAGSFPGFTYDYVADIYFYNANWDGGLIIADFFDKTGYPHDDYIGTWKYVLAGDQLYTGGESDPSLKFDWTGPINFALTDEAGANYNLKVGVCQQCVTAPVPEPSTWMTMILGFGLVGGLMRKRVSQVFRRRAHA